ncbi:MAG: hypothetical protein QM709_05580 [Spongiibacteraceae bacterium]
MIKYLKIAALLSVSVITGCAHNIQITPVVDNLRNGAVKAKSELNVGYYISPEDKAKVVTSPGGGGDKISYSPYKDTEEALNTVLSKTYKKVYSVSSLSDKDFVAQKQITYIFKPQLTTTSSSKSAFTWPPTDFSLTITCVAVDSNGNEVWKDTVTGSGHAEFDEFKKDFPLAARRASEAAFKQLQEKLPISTTQTH